MQVGSSEEKEAAKAAATVDHIFVESTGSGPLSGLTFAVKDVFHVKGGVTGFGHPDWLRTHGAEAVTAVAVQQLLDAGATMVGKTVTDELAYSLTGENYHYGTPINPRDATRIPGGSSSGSASAVGGGLVDFALGSDCGGSVRIPASYCGLFGMRPTHGRISLEGAIPFAPSFDCAGWFARDIGLFDRVGRILLGKEAPKQEIRTLLLATDALADLAPEVQEALLGAVALVETVAGPAKRVTLAENGLDRWSETFRTLQAAEIWGSLGEWIEKVRPMFGPGIRERFTSAATLDPTAVDAARKQRVNITERLWTLLPVGTALILPTAPRSAPYLASKNEELETIYRHQAMNLLCVAGLGGLPQISLPMVELNGLPIGLSLIGGRGTDLALLDLAKKICGEHSRDGLEIA
ncbi:amidase [Pseudaminobacter sp. NGMCC 1.201702]|uniref:amidase n=1 Tax=Pseudaminobacter sp. NGMCC 1.201702 TaxID=3391825 RepID=UPI0039EF40DB